MEEPEAVTKRRREELFERHVVPEIPVLFRVAISLTGQQVDAEDLVQDTLVRAYRAVERFDGEHPRAWLLTILRNTEINRNRRTRPELLREPEDGFDRLVTSPDRDVTEDAALAGEFDAAVERAFVGLPEKFRIAVGLIDIDGLSYAEAAQVLGVPEGTIMSRLHRGRTRIRQQLAMAHAAPKRRRM